MENKLKNYHLKKNKKYYNLLEKLEKQGADDDTIASLRWAIFELEQIYGV